MTLNEMASMQTDTLHPSAVASILGVNPQSLRKQAVECPERLGFPVIVIGSRVLIPRRAFLAFMGVPDKEVR